MEYSLEICSLILKNVAQVIEARNALDVVDEHVCEKINEFIKESIAGQDYLKVDSNEDGEIFLYGKNWEQNKGGKPIAAFWLDCQGDHYDLPWLSVLGGIAPGTSGGFFLWYDRDLKGFKKKNWKTFLKDFYIRHPSLRNSGFSLNEDGTCITWLFKLDLQCLAENYPDLDDCFENIGNGLKAISEQSSVFESLLKEADKLARQGNS